MLLDQMVLLSTISMVLVSVVSLLALWDLSRTRPIGPVRRIRYVYDPSIDTYRETLVYAELT